MRPIAHAIWIALATGVALAETGSVIDPTESLEPARPPAAAPRSSAQPEAAPKRERAEAEQRRRAKAQARVREAEKRAAEKNAAEKRAAENERARLRALEQARHAAAVREAARRATAAQAAAVQAAIARATAAKAAAARLEASREAAREAAARELAEREAAARDKEMKEEAARLAAAKEAADRLLAAREAARREGEVKRVAARDAPMLKELQSNGAFRDCARCPELVWLPQGEFVMGDASAPTGTRQVVAIRYRLAVGRFEVTFSEWDACVAAGGCRRRPHDAGWGRGWQPVINVSWADAQQYVAWLSRSTGRRYRLLTEAEWEYAARAGTDVRYWWGNQAGRGDANCAECGSKWDGRQAAPVGRFAPNPFGLHDMHGNVSEWVEDCYHERCGAADARVVRGGAWYGSARSTRSTSRMSATSEHADNGIGFRVARTE